MVITNATLTYPAAFEWRQSAQKFNFRHRHSGRMNSGLYAHDVIHRQRTAYERTHSRTRMCLNRSTIISHFSDAVVCEYVAYMLHVFRRAETRDGVHVYIALCARNCVRHAQALHAHVATPRRFMHNSIIPFDFQNGSVARTLEHRAPTSVLLRWLPDFARVTHVLVAEASHSRCII